MNAALDDLASILGTMKFLPCPRCGEQAPASRREGTHVPQLCHVCANPEAAATEHAEELARASETLPASYRWASFGAPELARRVAGAQAIAEARDIVNAGDRWVVLTGPAGLGKTSLAVAMHREIARKSARPGLFVHAYRLGIARIQHRAGDGECEDVRAAMRHPLVLIDDIGAERQTANNAVPDVVFERHAEGRFTVLTTGFEPEGIAKLYGDGFARRMFERAAVIRLEKAPAVRLVDRR